MQSISIFLSFERTKQTLLKYLRNHKYKIVKMDSGFEEIYAEKKRWLLKKDTFHFKILPVGELVSKIDIKVNPHKTTPVKSDINLEIKIQEKIYEYF